MTACTSDAIGRNRCAACTSHKPDDGQRPLGIPALEDKILQSAVAELLSTIYEIDFLGFSYRFQPGRSPHRALQALHTALMTQYVNWVLDADIRRFFDSVDHEWLLRMLAHRVADARILRLVRGCFRHQLLLRRPEALSGQGRLAPGSAPPTRSRRCVLIKIAADTRRPLGT